MSSAGFLTTGPVTAKLWLLIITRTPEMHHHTMRKVTSMHAIVKKHPSPNVFDYFLILFLHLYLDDCCISWYLMVDILMICHWWFGIVWQTLASARRHRAILQRNALVFGSFKRKPMRPASLFLCCQMLSPSRASLVNRFY